MTTPNDPNPAPDSGLLSEAQLLDWIDGHLSPQEEARLAALSGRIGLSRRIEQMRANKRALTRAGQAAAPAELHDRVIAALEREALLDAPVETPDSIPISTVVFERERTRSRWMHSAAAPLAFAAGLALLVTGAAYWVIASRPPAQHSKLNGPLAINDAPAEPIASPSAPTADATNTMMAAAPAATMEHAPDAGIPGFASEPAPTTMTLASSRKPIDDARALELAREGRLVMRVVADNVKVLGDVERDTTRPTRQREWRLSKDVPAVVAQAVAPSSTPFGFGSRDEFAFASRDALSMLGPKAALNWPAMAMIDRAARVKGTYLADVPVRESTLRAMKSVFADRLNARVIFEELDAPVHTPPRLDAESALWWTRPSARWTDRVSIPVVVEQR